MLTDFNLESAGLLFLSIRAERELDAPSLGTEDEPTKLRIFMIVLLRLVSCCYWDSTGVLITM